LISDRYSRLRAIKDYGFKFDFTDLQNKIILICGVGGIGSLSAEMLARCGVGKLILIDVDTVEEANLNRVLYRPEHIGRKKAEVCTEILHEINPDVSVEFITTDIMSIDFEEAFELIISHCDLILNGLDNIPARQYLNVKCVLLNRPYVDAGALRSGLGGYVHLVIPKKTACYQCTASVQINVKSNDAKGPQCAASLPSTLAVISSLQVQQSLKFLLNFGKNADFISYNGLNDEFTILTLKKDDNCYVCGNKKKIEYPSITLEITNDEIADLMGKLRDQEQEIKNLNLNNPKNEKKKLKKAIKKKTVKKMKKK
jgi:ubiquitin-like modifier-activating enzyme 5